MDWRGTILLLLTVQFLGTGCSSRHQLSSHPPWRDFGPFYSKHRDLDGVTRERALGPLLERAASPAGDRMTAIRPFWSQTRDATEEKLRHEVLWPLGSMREFLGQRQWWLGPVWSWNYDIDDPDSQTRFWIVPIWASGKARDGKDYRALFPFYGTVRDFAGRDEMQFVLFPIYSRTRINDVKSTAWFWPIYSRTKGEGVERFRVFPFYGWSTFREHTHKSFILWPFFTTATYTFPDHPGKAWILFPFYGQLSTPEKTLRFFLPPLFRIENEANGRKVHAPWPIYQRQMGDDIDKFYIWPLVGRKTIAGESSAFALWPVFWRQKIVRAQETLHRWLALPVVQIERRETAEGEVTGRTLKLWPLGTHRASGSRHKTRLLDLWPLMETGGIERNWAPLWTLFQHEERFGGQSETELLWGFGRALEQGPNRHYRSIFPVWESWREPATQGWGVGKGLFGIEHVQGKRRIRLFWGLTLSSGGAP